MKKGLIIALFMALATFAHGQDLEDEDLRRVHGTLDFGAGLSYLRWDATSNQVFGYQTSGSSILATAANFERTTDRYFFGVINIHGGIQVDIVSNYRYSIGVNPNLGIGLLYGLNGENSEETFPYIGLPTYAYYRLNFGYTSHSFMLGYRPSWQVLRFNHALLAYQFEKHEVYYRLYGTVLGQKYYTQFGDGRTVPSIWLREVGITVGGRF